MNKLVSISDIKTVTGLDNTVNDIKNQVQNNTSTFIKNTVINYINGKLGLSVCVRLNTYSSVIREFISKLYPRKDLLKRGDIILSWDTNNIIRRNKVSFDTRIKSGDINFKTIFPRTYCSVSFIDNFSESYESNKDQYKVVKITFIGKHSNRLMRKLLNLLKENSGMNQALLNHENSLNNNKIFNVRNYTTGDDYCVSTITGVGQSDIITSAENIDRLKDISKFINSKNIYNLYDIPYKLGILLYGEPGCGKSTMIRRILDIADVSLRDKILKDFPEDANHIYNGNMSNVINVSFINMSDKKLEDCLNSITSRINNGYIPLCRYYLNIIVLEELDSIYTHKRDDTNIKIEQLSNIRALLQFLDSASSPQNTIFIGTTNYINKLDPALIRSGRFDIKIKMDPFKDGSEAGLLCDKFKVERDILSDMQYPIIPSELQYKLFKKVYDTKN